MFYTPINLFLTLTILQYEQRKRKQKLKNYFKKENKKMPTQKMPNYAGPIGNTPKGIAVFPKLRKPDVYQDKVIGYTLKLKLSEEEIQKYQEKFDKLIQEAIQQPEFKGKNFQRPIIPITQEKDGSYALKFKSKCEFKDKNDQIHPVHIDIYDAKLNLIDNDEEIPNGSIVRVSYTPRVFWSSSLVYGIKLSINAVQLIEKAKSRSGGKTAQDFGFQMEDGYDYTKDTEEIPDEENYPETDYPEPSEDYSQTPEPPQSTYSESFSYNENQNPLI